MKHVPASLLLLVIPLLGPGATARAAAAREAEKPAPPAAGMTRALARDPARLFFDAPGDGSIWVRGADYKAGFDANGARVVPWLGAHAAGDQSLRFAPVALARGGEPIAFASGVLATRAGDTVEFDRGSFRERYSASVDSIEQTFVFERLHGAGDLVLNVGIETALRPRAASAGLRFEGDLGGLTYSRALAFDAAGRSELLETRLAGASIEIVVPGWFADAATFPLTIDPVIASYTIDIQTVDHSSPDVAYDASSDRYIACFEEAFSATDHDIFAQIYDSNGSVFVAQYIDVSGTDWRRPRVANNNLADQFMVVAHAGPAPARSIVSRVTSAAFGVLGNQVTVAPSGSGYERVNPDIGGDPNLLGPTNYLVVFEEMNFNTGDRWIVQQLMRTTGLPDSSAPTCIECNTGKRFNPSISKSAGPDGSGVDNRWNIAWEYQFNATDHDIYGAQNFNAWTVTAPFAISTSFSDERNPSASSYLESSSTPGRYLVAYQRFNASAGEYDIHGQVLDGSSFITLSNLSALEGADFVGQSQIGPAADSDGSTFVVAYSELYGTSTTDWDVYISSFALAGNVLSALDVHANLEFSLNSDVQCRIAASRAPQTLRTMAVWTQAIAGDGDIFGGLYETPLVAPYCFPGVNGVTTCPCSNPPLGSSGCDNSLATGGAELAGSGTPSVSNDTFVLTQSGELPFTLSIFLQGDADIAAGTVFGGGVRCVGGALKRLYTRNATDGVVSAPGGADPTISAISSALGDAIPACNTRLYQVYYRDPNIGFCPAGFNVGSALRVLWVP